MNIWYILLLLTCTAADNNDYYLDDYEYPSISSIEISTDDNGRVKYIDIYYEDEEYFDLVPEGECQ